jgi:hypothetical protein
MLGDERPLDFSHALAFLHEGLDVLLDEVRETRHLATSLAIYLCLSLT